MDDIILTTGSVFDAIASPDRAANLKIRAKLMDRLIEYIEDNDLSQTEAGEVFGVGQPRISYLTNGRISKFTIDALINMCNAAGIEVDVSFDGAHAGHDI
jgi:predicted XRE-type DNA-binding protein